MVVAWVLVSKEPSHRMATTTYVVLALEVTWFSVDYWMGCGIRRPSILTVSEVI